MIMNVAKNQIKTFFPFLASMYVYLFQWKKKQELIE